MQRILEPEILDSLPPDHPDALRNRRDLHLINRLMGNHRWFAQTLPPLLRNGEQTLELGAGLGELAARLAAEAVAVDGLDLWKKPADWPTPQLWHQTDLLDFDGFAPYRAVVGNLIFHQFSAAELLALGEKLGQHARIILACEPARRRSSQLGFAVLGRALRVNHVSLHDAHVSIAAGFAGEELPRALGLDPARWNFRCQTTWFGAYRMVAIRRA
jgi:hypothetical protein